MTGALLISSISAQAEISEQKAIDLARKIYFRMTGTPLREGNLRDQMSALVRQEKFVEAAQLASQSPGFINNTMRQFSASMNNQNQNAREITLTESMAYIMLVARENRPFSDILTGRDFPTINGQGTDCFNPTTGVRCDLSSPTVLGSNATNRTVASQVPNNVASGIYTMRGFGNAAFMAGTNRRALQQTFNQLFCLSNENMKSDISDISYIGRDVSRAPDGDPTTSGAFEQECRKCHSVMDGLRGAFAFMDVDGGGQLTYRANGQDNGVAAKYSRAADVYPDGYRTVDDRWEVTFDRDPAMMAKLGWPSGMLGGNGVASFASAVSETRQFYSCMVEKVIDTVCPNDPNNKEKGKGYMLDPAVVLPPIVNKFKENRNIRDVFAEIVVRPECLGR